MKFRWYWTAIHTVFISSFNSRSYRSENVYSSRC